jgi:hypothetical protein
VVLLLETDRDVPVTSRSCSSEMLSISAAPRNMICSALENSFGRLLVVILALFALFESGGEWYGGRLV